jgi:Mn2+/Fe2+ NRAMP family transporter
MMNRRRSGLQRLRSLPGLLRGIGPEVLAAASDNDPTNVGTAAAVGAQTGYQLSWVAVLVAPLLGVVMTIAAHVAGVAQADLQSLTLKRYGRGAAALLLASIVPVNVITMAADLQAGAAGIGLLAGIDFRWLIAPLGAVLVGLLLIGRYDEVVAVLRYLVLGFLAFGAAAFLARPDWHALLRATVIPSMSLRTDEVAGALALLGTTLTTYVYLWETIGRGVEEAPGAAAGAVLARAKIGAVVGAVFTAVILWFMLVACAATLGRHHLAVTSAQEAAGALRPLAGSLAANLFAAGLLTSAVVALPILMATTAHAVGAQFDWRRGLSKGLGPARRFYAILIGSVALALVLALANISVITMLEAASVLGGLAAPVGLVFLIRLATDPQVMGPHTVSRGLAVAGWAVTAVIGGFGVLLVVGFAVSGL